MSTDIGVLKDTGPKKLPLNVNVFFGGSETGICVSLSTNDGSDFNAVRLSAADVIALIPLLWDNVVSPEMQRQEKRLKAEIEKDKALLGTIFQDQLKVSQFAQTVKSFELASLLFYGAKEFEGGAR